MINLWDELHDEVTACTKCPRLRQHCQNVAQVKRRAYLDHEYWGKPVPGWGDENARLVIVGLAPGAHGSNRTGRMFTGDASGNFLYAALHRAGFCTQPESRWRDDGLTLKDVYITAVGRCSPPGNKPYPGELENCRPFLEREFALLGQAKVVLVLGKIAFDGVIKLERFHDPSKKSRLAFFHGAVYPLDGAILVASYHVSQQNTLTGRLTVAMFEGILSQCREYLG